MPNKLPPIDLKLKRGGKSPEDLEAEDTLDESGRLAELTEGLTQEDEDARQRDGIFLSPGDECFYKYTDKGGLRKLCNYGFEVLYRIEDEDDFTKNTRVVRLQNEQGQRKLIDLQIDKLTSLSSWKAATEAHGNFVFFGSQADLDRLKARVFGKEKRAIKISTLGWQPEYGFWAWANGVFRDGQYHATDKFGCVAVGERIFYIPAFSQMHKGQAVLFENERRFAHQTGTTGFKDWSRAFLEVYGENAAIAILYAVSTVFRDLIFKQTGFFPHLQLFGQAGTGKSTCVKSILALFGRPQNLIGLGGRSTIASYMRRLAQFSNAPVAFDEYKNNIDPKIIESLKNVYDGIGYERAAKDQTNRTHQTRVISSLLIAGQEAPVTEAAYNSRIILLSLQGELNKPKLLKLIRIQEEGLTCVTHEILNGRAAMEQEFAQWYDSARKALKDATLRKAKEGGGVLDRLYGNSAILVATYHALKDVLPWQFDIDKYMDAFVSNILRLATMRAATDEAATWWQMFEAHKLEGRLVMGRDYDFTHQAKEYDGREILWVSLTLSHKLYQEAMRKQTNQVGLDRTSLQHYLKHTAPFVDHKSSIRFSDRGPTSAWGFDYAQLSKQTGINLMKDEPSEPVGGQSHVLDLD